MGRKKGYPVWDNLFCVIHFIFLVFFQYTHDYGAQSGARHDRVGMTATLMNGIPVIYPSLPEQQKIADCLSALDAVIEQQKETLEKWQELKKGLLQQMFV